LVDYLLYLDLARKGFREVACVDPTHRHRIEQIEYKNIIKRLLQYKSNDVLMLKLQEALPLRSVSAGYSQANK